MKPTAWRPKHFTPDELCKPERQAATTATIWASLDRLGVELDKARAAIGKPIRVTSGFRDPAANKAAGGAQTSQHLLGEAADIVVDGMTPEALARAVVAAGVEYDQLIVEPSWVHVSVGPRNRRQGLRKTSSGYDAWRP